MRVPISIKCIMVGVSTFALALLGACTGSSNGSNATLLKAGLDVNSLNDAQVAQVTDECHHRQDGDSDHQIDESADGSVSDGPSDDNGAIDDQGSDAGADGDQDVDEGTDETSGGARSVGNICRQLFKRERNRHGDQGDRRDDKHGADAGDNAADDGSDTNHGGADDTADAGDD